MLVCGSHEQSASDVAVYHSEGSRSIMPLIITIEGKGITKKLLQKNTDICLSDCLAYNAQLESDADLR